jgi:rhodanese-related sulfurtransferase
MQKQYPHSQFRITPPPKNPPLQPFILGMIAILVIVGFFLIRNYQYRASIEKNSTEKSTVDSIKNNQGIPLISAEDTAAAIYKKNFKIIDIRAKASFDQTHIENSLNLPADSFSIKGMGINPQETLIIVDQTPSAEGKNIVQELIKQGYKTQYLDGGFARYLLEGMPLISFGNPNSIADQAKTNPLTADELLQKITNGEQFVFLDVRPKTSFEQSHIEKAINIPLEELENRKAEIPLGKILIYDDDPTRSYQASVRLYDLNIWGAAYLSEKLDVLKGKTNQN